MTPIPAPAADEADRLLDGRPLASDLDGPYGAVAKLLIVAGSDLDDVHDPSDVLLGELRLAATSGPVDLAARRAARSITKTLVIAGALVFGGTAAAAASGSLPDALQDVAHDVGDAVGLSLPAGSQDGPGHGRSDEAPGRPEEPGNPGDDPSRSDEAPGQPDGTGAATPPSSPPADENGVEHGNVPTSLPTDSGNRPDDPGGGAPDEQGSPLGGPDGQGGGAGAGQGGRGDG